MSHLIKIYAVCKFSLFSSLVVTELTDFYSIPSSEFNAYLKQIKVILSTVKKYPIIPPVTNTIYIFSLCSRGFFDHIGLHFFQKGSRMHCLCLTLRYGSTHVNRVTDITL